MISCEVCGQLFLVEMDSCPICNQKRKNTEEGKTKLFALIHKLLQTDITNEFKQLLERIINENNNASGKK